jgi:hypothetical protein
VAKRTTTRCPYCEKFCRGRCAGARQARKVKHDLEAIAKGRPTWEQVHGKRRVSEERGREIDAMVKAVPMRDHMLAFFGDDVKYHNTITGEVRRW